MYQGSHDKSINKKRNKKKKKDKDKNLGEKILWYACRWPQWEPPSSLRPALHPHDDDDGDNDDGDDDDDDVDDDDDYDDNDYDDIYIMVKCLYVCNVFAYFYV